MKAILKLALHDLRLTARDRPAFFWILVLPVALMFFFGAVVGGGSANVPPKISLSVADEDGGWLARALIEELTDERIALRELGPEEVDVSEERVRTLVIPAGFTAGALAGEQQVLRLEKEPGTSAEFGLAAQVHVVRAIVRTLTRTVELQRAGVELAGDAAVERFRALGERPELVRLEVSHAGTGRPVPQGRAQSVPGILTMSVLMMTLIYGGVFLTLEKQGGMLRRQAVLPVSRRALLTGKWLGRFLLAALQIVVLVVIGRAVLGVSWGDSPAGMTLALGSYAVAVAGMATCLGAVTRTPAQASSVGWIGAMILAAVGGCWWPAELMPEWMQTLALALPTGWAMRAFHALISFGQGVEAVLLPSALLLGFGAAFTAVGVRWLRFG